ncbi:LrgB family protein [Bordetella genomosp. 9]|uniref:LrgB family protein n=1 Tax=Bordetella genomosp. 9 TaxID=1416803 RepID=UPI0018DFEB5D|nr:LrgB family protein [Bordetella genomosp. 9]
MNAMQTVLPFLCLAWTLLLYFLVKPLYRRYRKPWVSPAILVPALTVVVMVLARIPYSAYFQETHWLTWLMGPATVAFAVPIYEYRNVARRHALSLGLGVVTGMVVAVVSSCLLARMFGFAPEVTHSLMARSISTPFAVALAERTGGSAELVSLFTIITGLVGMIAGDALLALLRLRSRLAHGASFGAAAHGFGAARARERDSEEGVVASLTLVIAGVGMVVAGPALSGWVSRLLGV